jgi:hypothetical protein
MHGPRHTIVGAIPNPDYKYLFDSHGTSAKDCTLDWVRSPRQQVVITPRPAVPWDGA